MSFSDFTIKSAEETLKELNSSEFGLSEKEAASRLKKFGFNRLEEKRETFWRILARQFKSPLVYLLFGAGFLSLLLGSRVDALVIAVVLFLNGALGFIQEFRSERALERLKNYIVKKVKTRRIRNNEKTVETFNAENLVLGDVILISKGDIVPADLRILKSRNLEFDESILTGEPYPVLKKSEPLAKKTEELSEAKNIAFAGTAVSSGFGEGAVIAVGKETQIGKISGLVAKAKHFSVFEENIAKLSKFLLKVVLISLALIFLANFFLKKGEGAPELFLFTIALAIGIVPEALPAVAALTMSRGALRLARKGVVVKRLSAIEDLGDIEILCSDKTGTVTKNKMEVKNVFSENPEECLEFNLVSSPQSDFEKLIFENPFDEAVWNAAGEKVKKKIRGYEILAEMPFDPVSRINAVLAKSGESVYLLAKGAPEEIFKISKIEESKSEEYQNRFKESDSAGLRTIALGYKKFKNSEEAKGDWLANLKEGGFEFSGIVSFHDPLKETAKDAVHLAQKLGIELKIITGDAAGVAGSIGRELGLIKKNEDVFDAERLARLGEKEFEAAVKAGKVFARVSPELKQKIVAVLNRFHPVGFLGEGINDAPALKEARVAIVVDSGADVSKEVGDIILLKKDLHTIIDGIREGRGIFSNIHKYLTYTLVGNFGNLYTIAAISIVLKFLPLLPAQILLANLVTDLPMLAIAADTIEKEEIKRPKKYNLKSLAVFVLLFGFVDSVFDFVFFGIFAGKPPELLRTLWFLEVVFSEVILIFSLRTAKPFFRAAPPAKILVIASLVAIFGSAALTFSGLGGEYFHFVPPPVSALA
ncbi:MAG: cation-transporting P-type ATPase, partial [Patescibacteria group bacterium]